MASPAGSSSVGSSSAGSSSIGSSAAGSSVAGASVGTPQALSRSTATIKTLINLNQVFLISLPPSSWEIGFWS
jgi:preprotein translocase subunit SecG